MSCPSQCAIYLLPEHINGEHHPSSRDLAQNLALVLNKLKGCLLKLPSVQFLNASIVAVDSILTNSDIEFYLPQQLPTLGEPYGVSFTF